MFYMQAIKTEARNVYYKLLIILSSIYIINWECKIKNLNTKYIDDVLNRMRIFFTSGSVQNEVVSTCLINFLITVPATGLFIT